MIINLLRGPVTVSLIVLTALSLDPREHLGEFLLVVALILTVASSSLFRARGGAW